MKADDANNFLQWMTNDGGWSKLFSRVGSIISFQGDSVLKKQTEYNGAAIPLCLCKFETNI